MYECMCVCNYICMYVCMYVCLYVLEGVRACTGLCVDVSSGVPPGNDINENN